MNLGYALRVRRAQIYGAYTLTSWNLQFGEEDRTRTIKSYNLSQRQCQWESIRFQKLEELSLPRVSTMLEVWTSHMERWQASALRDAGHSGMNCGKGNEKLL